METQDLEMDELFDEEQPSLEEDIEMSTATAFPDLETGDLAMAVEDDAAAEGQGEEEGAQLNRLRDLSKGATMKRVQRPQPKLDAARLKSDRGLPVLPKMFETVKFKGKGYEVEDLQQLMGKLEHWAHRLFPKLTFDNFIERLEKLGSKKEVQNCVKRMRLDMPVLDEDFVQQYDDDEPKKGEDKGRGPDQDELDADQAFEEMMLREQEEYRHEKQRQIAERGLSDEEEYETAPCYRGGDIEEPLTPERDSSASHLREKKTATPMTPSAPQQTPVSPSSSVRAEQKARMEQNKMLALQKRATRLGVPVSQLLSPKPAVPDSVSQSQGHSKVAADGSLMDYTLSHSSQSVSQDKDTSLNNSKLEEDDMEMTLQNSDTQKTTINTSNDNDQQIEEELLLFLETDEDFPAKKISLQQKSSQNSVEENKGPKKTDSVHMDGNSGENGVEMESMSEEFSIINKVVESNLQNALEKEGSDKFSIFQKGKQTDDGWDSVETEEMSAVLTVKNNNQQKDEVLHAINEESEEIDSVDLDSESVPLI